MTTFTYLAKSKPTAEELGCIRELADVCNRFDQIDLKLNLDMLENRPGTDTNDFFCYDQGKLVGYGGLYVFHQGEAEVSGMVHPDYRGKGIFRCLQQLMEEECRSRKIPQLLFIVQRGSEAGKSYMEKASAQYRFSEYWMEREEAGQKSPVLNGRIQLRRSTPNDLETLIQLSIAGFQMDETRAREMSERMEQDPKQTTYLIVDDQSEPIGRISVSQQPDHAFIFGFTVHPDHQGKGYGREALAKTIDLLSAEGFSKIILEVATENSNALSLYESCGFRVKSANDYYRHPL
ncbi:GNAT family N-acetyltransferase [Brevibacillus borstelensis]|uniref:GNAT family N-acetyltransferase n=1 Tax=Brevibacillus borstelensis TaxID=45462 RepID=UPI0030C4E9C5